MIKFAIYIFESSLCLSILALVYLLFFRRETYFNFNRYYLLGSMIFALLIPTLTLNLRVDNFEGLETPISEIGQFRTSYEKIIFGLDPSYETLKYQTIKTIFFEEYSIPGNIYFINSETETPIKNADNIFPSENNNTNHTKIFRLIVLIYFMGVGIFVVRLSMLFVWLFRTIKTNPIINHKGFKIVQLEGDVPPFSFLRYLFVNQHAVSHSDLQQILAHEKVHIRQNHSIDLLLAHGISVLQWFNPFAWLLQKSIKTTHEYIADRKVVDQGFELIDYQSLLLSQLISIRSVELVNNFNLISIKKRIAMMTKNKSGFSSKLKALVIIPFALILFFVFSDMTVKGPGKLLANYYDREFLDETVQLEGLWKSKLPDSQEEYLFFTGNKLSVLEKGNQVREYLYEFKNDKLYIKTNKLEAIPLKYKKTARELTIWWNESLATTFVKSTSANTLEDLLQSNDLSIKLPTITQTQIIDNQTPVIRIFMNKDQMQIGENKIQKAALQRQIKNEQSKFRAIDLPYVTIQLFVDESTPMGKLNYLQQILRQESLYKIAYAGTTDDNKISSLLAHDAALPQKLPPIDAKYLDDSELEKLDLKLFKINLSGSKEEIASLPSDLAKFISKSDKYLLLLNFDNNTTFGNHLNS
ncbi:MAG: M56 family metallopeptidase, partial [Bacteroidales bacterium]|nr:M56 family metallopeptidase [Bacteroidales bacterium]